MSTNLKNYRKEAFRAIRELLAHRGAEIVDYYVGLAKATKSENELSRVMVDVREEI